MTKEQGALAAQVAERWSILGQAFMTMLTGSRWLRLKGPAPIRGRARLRLGAGGRAAENRAPRKAEESGPLLLLRSIPVFVRTAHSSMCSQCPA
jgi:hypothetical protein